MRAEEHIEYESIHKEDESGCVDGEAAEAMIAKIIQEVITVPGKMKENIIY